MDLCINPTSGVV